MNLHRLKRRLLRLLLLGGANVALDLSERAPHDRFEGAAGETSAEFQQLAGWLLDWAHRVGEIRHAAAATTRGEA